MTDLLRFLRSRRAMFMLAAASLLIFAALAARLNTSTDIGVYYLAAGLAHDGRSPYSDYPQEWQRVVEEKRFPASKPYKYPPHLAAFLSPFSERPFAAVALAWKVLSILAMLAGALLLGAALFPRGDPWRVPGMVLPLCVLCLYFPAILAVDYGQVSGLMFVLVTLALWCLARGRGIGGAALGAGVCLKLMPLPLILWDIWHGRWRSAAAGAAAIAGLTLLSLAFVPWSLYEEYLSVAYKEAFPASKSLAGVVAATPMGALIRASIFPEEVARSAAWALFVAMAAASAWFCRPLAAGAASARMLQAQFALIVALTLSAPATILPYAHLLLLIPLGVAARLALARALRPALGALAGLWLLVLCMFPGLSLLQKLGVALPVSAYAIIWAFYPLLCLFLWAYLCVELQLLRAKVGYNADARRRADEAS